MELGAGSFGNSSRAFGGFWLDRERGLWIACDGEVIGKDRVRPVKPESDFFLWWRFDSGGFVAQNCTVPPKPRRFVLRRVVGRSVSGARL